MTRGTDTMFKDKSILITGGTGSLGKALLKRLLSGEKGTPRLIRVLSRDEAKQSVLKAELKNHKVEFQIGDVRDFSSVAGALREINIVFNAAALKQVPSCE